MTRRPIIMANWKMNKLPSEAGDYIRDVAPKLKAYPTVDTVLAGQDVLLNAMVQAARKTTIGIGAENVYWEDKGAYTGETSPAVLADLGIQYVIIGHSERRNYFRETDEMVNQKTLAALRHGMVPIIAIDEDIVTATNDDHMHWAVNEVIEAVKGVPAAEASKLMFAFEPTAAIGSGKAMEPADIQQRIHMIRMTLADIYGIDIANQIRILYGGSVKPANAFDIMREPDVDGLLVGDAALDAGTFLELVRLSAQATQ